jgi:uncharacterized membrane protein
LHYFPIALPFLLLFALFLVFLVLLIEVGILRYAYQRIGVGRRHMFALLVLSFLGSYVNIPIYELSPHAVQSDTVISFGGMSYVVPEVTDWPGTVVAINVGGAIIPTLLSLYLMRKNRLFFRGLLATGIVVLVVHALAYPVKGVGIAEPVFVPPLISTMVALLLSRRHAPPLAYISGSLGTLIGADLLNLGKIPGLGAPVASIGGAGTFDGIFLTGILSVLLVSIMTPRETPIDSI